MPRIIVMSTSTCGVRKLDRVPARGLARLLTSGIAPEFWLSG